MTQPPTTEMHTDTDTKPTTESHTELHTQPHTEDAPEVLPTRTIVIRALSVVGLGVVAWLATATGPLSGAVPGTVYLGAAVAFGAAYAAYEFGLLFAASCRSLDVDVTRPARLWNVPGMLPGLLHEATHAAAARLAGGSVTGLQVDHGSHTVRVDLPDAPAFAQFFTALAPTFVGAALLALLWPWLMLPYPPGVGLVEALARVLGFCAVIYYSFPSPADVGAAIGAVVSTLSTVDLNQAAVTPLLPGVIVSGVIGGLLLLDVVQRTLGYPEPPYSAIDYVVPVGVVVICMAASMALFLGVHKLTFVTLQRLSESRLVGRND